MTLARNWTNIVAGLFFMGIALMGLWFGWHLRSDTAVTMGPGYVPKSLCVIQIVLGAALVATGFLRDAEPAEPWVWRPLIAILVAIVVFALTVQRFGLVVAVMSVVIIAGTAHHSTRMFETVALAVGLTAFAVLAFVTGLGLTIPVWPEF